MIYLRLTLTFIGLIWGHPLWASHGIVTVFEAPLLSEPDLEKARVLQQVHRGQKVFIHPKDVPPGPHTQKYSDAFNHGGVVDGPQAEGFFQTLDAVGNEAYIEKRYVKIVYKDQRELATNTRPFEVDHTDYRLEEPIPDGYPFLEPPKKRLELAFVNGPSQRVVYPYSLSPEREDYGRRMGLSFNYSARVEDDVYDRFYFGTQIHLLFQSTEIFFDEFEIRSRESLGQIGAGPIAIYNFLRTKDYRLSLTGGITLNYHRALIEMRDNEMLESRIFDGFSITPKIAGHYVRSDFFPMADLLIGAQMQLNIEHSLSPRDEGGGLEHFWNETNDQLSIPTGGVFAVFLGFQTSY